MEGKLLKMKEELARREKERVEMEYKVNSVVGEMREVKVEN